MTQFAFLQAEFPNLADPAGRAEASALTDPRGACFYARLALEVGLALLYQREPLRATRPSRTSTKIDTAHRKACSGLVFA